MATLDINIRQANADFQSIKSAIVDSGVTIKDDTKTSEYASKINEVYEAGKKVESDAFWDKMQNYGNRTEYLNAFAFWNCEYIRPKHKVAPAWASTTIQTFRDNSSLKKIEKEYFDFSNCIRATYFSGSYYYTF